MILVWLIMNPDVNYFDGVEVDFIFADKLGIDIKTVLILIVLFSGLAYALHEGHRDMKSLGKIEIFITGVDVHYEGEEPKTYEFKDVNNFTIRRRSTWQHESRDDNYLKKFGSLIAFDTQNEVHSFEFLIESKEHNVAFERMVDALRNERVDFLYTSV